MLAESERRCAHTHTHTERERERDIYISGMGHTDFWDVPYNIIRYYYAIRV